MFGRFKDENCQNNMNILAEKKPLGDELPKLHILCIPNSENIEHAYNCKLPLKEDQRKAKGKELQNTEGYLMQLLQIEL